MIEVDQDGIEPANMIRTMCHPQDDDKQDAMTVVGKNKQLHMFY